MDKKENEIKDLMENNNFNNAKSKKIKNFLTNLSPYISIATIYFLLIAVFNTSKILLENKKLISISNYVKENYYTNALSEKELEEIMIEGMINNLPDNYSLYMNKEMTKEYKDNFNGIKTGIGITIAGNKIGALLENSPAIKSGLQIGDELVSINGIDVLDIENEKYDENMISISKSIETTEKNKFVIKRDGQIMSYDISKESYNTKIVEYEIIDDKIGLLKLNLFSEAMFEDFDKAIETFKENNIAGLIIDLRYNLGGEKRAVEYVADELMKDVVIGTIEYENGTEEEIMKTDSNALEVPMVVLTNKFTASSSEVLAGAIVSNKKGITIGTNTYGKGTVLGGISFKDGSSITISIGEIVLSNGEKLEGIGVKPYIEELDESKHIDLALNHLKNIKK